MGAVGSLQQLESDIFQCGFHFLHCSHCHFLQVCAPLRADEVRVCLIAGDVDRKISVKIEEFFLRDVPFWGDGDQIEEFLENDIFVLVAQFEFLEI